MVRDVGFEPTRAEAHRVLNPDWINLSKTRGPLDALIAGKDLAVNVIYPTLSGH